MMMLRAIATSAAASAMMNSTTTWPTAGSLTKNRFMVTKFREAAEKISSPAINMPMSVRRRTRPKMPAANRNAASAR